MSKITSKRRRTENPLTMNAGQQDEINRRTPVEEQLSQRAIRLARRQKRADDLINVFKKNSLTDENKKIAIPLLPDRNFTSMPRVSTG